MRVPDQRQRLACQAALGPLAHPLFSQVCVREFGDRSLLGLADASVKRDVHALSSACTTQIPSVACVHSLHPCMCPSPPQLLSLAMQTRTRGLSQGVHGSSSAHTHVPTTQCLPPGVCMLQPLQDLQRPCTWLLALGVRLGWTLAPATALTGQRHLEQQAVQQHQHQLRWLQWSSSRSASTSQHCSSTLFAASSGLHPSLSFLELPAKQRQHSAAEQFP